MEFNSYQELKVSTHSRAEAAAIAIRKSCQSYVVSTHSRAEAAATTWQASKSPPSGFNTQPRGGGCTRLI